MCQLHVEWYVIQASWTTEISVPHEHKKHCMFMLCKLHLIGMWCRHNRAHQQALHPLHLSQHLMEEIQEAYVCVVSIASQVEHGPGIMDYQGWCGICCTWVGILWGKHMKWVIVLCQSHLDWNMVLASQTTKVGVVSFAPGWASCMENKWSECLCCVNCTWIGTWSWHHRLLRLVLCPLHPGGHLVGKTHEVNVCVVSIAPGLEHGPGITDY